MPIIDSIDDKPSAIQACLKIAEVRRRKTLLKKPKPASQRKNYFPIKFKQLLIYARTLWLQICFIAKSPNGSEYEQWR